MTKVNGETIFKSYQLAVEMADRHSARRLASNTFYLTLQSVLLTAMVGFVGLKVREMNTVAVLVAMGLLSILGIILSIAWLFTIKSYRDLSSAKWGVILEIERHLPVKPFSDEWNFLETDAFKKWKEEVAGHAKPRRIYRWLRERNKYYTPQSAVERYIPITILCLQTIILLSTAIVAFIMWGHS